jgi:asparagine synthetase B (glutamine-hydrolysing)
MFLVAFTRHRVPRNFHTLNVVEIEKDSFIITVVTDNISSGYISEQNGFSIIESPLALSSDFRNIKLSEVHYNESDNLLTLSKPITSGRTIYFHINSGGDFYCSTHISMLRNAGVSIAENAEVLPEFFVYRYVMPPQTLYKDIKQLAAGNRLLVKFAAGKCEIVKTEEYNLPEPANDFGNIDEISAYVLKLLEKSVEILNPLKDRTTVLLSGGLDSSILFKLCRGVCETNDTYSTGYPFEEQDNNREKQYALSAAEALGAKHGYYQATTKEYLCGLLEAISLTESPLNHLQTPLLYLLFQKGIPKNKNIILSGLIADDLFGLPFHHSVYRREKISNQFIFKILSKYPLKQAMEFASSMTGRGKGFLNYLEKLPISDSENMLWSLGAYGSEDWVCEYFNVTKDDIIKGRYESIRRFHNRSIYDVISLLAFLGSGSITQALWAKLSESQGGILFCPFCDMDIHNYIFSLPWEIKLESPKSILCAVARKLKVPEFIINRPKSALGIGAIHWSRKGGTFEPLVPLASKVFDEKQIRDMQAEGPKNPMTFWNILNYSLWKRLCVDNEKLDVLLDQLDKNIADCGLTG